MNRKRHKPEDTSDTAAERPSQGDPAERAPHHQPEQNATTKLARQPTGQAERDPDLIDRARTQWQFGDWERLADLNEAGLYKHPQRARLALLAACAHQQLGQSDRSRRLVKQARQWGCDDNTIAQLLLAGAHNSLARAAALKLQRERATHHFRQAVAGVPGDERLACETRSNHEMARLGLYATADTRARPLTHEDLSTLTNTSTLRSPLSATETDLNSNMVHTHNSAQRILDALAAQEKRINDELHKAVAHIDDAGKMQSLNLAKQLEAFLSIQNYLRNGKLSGEMHGWPISPDFGYLLIEIIERNNYDLVIEFGSGTSTVLIAQALAHINSRRNGKPIKQVAFEHLEKYYEQTRADLASAGVADKVQLVHAPLQPYTSVAGEKYSYYNCQPTLSALAKISGKKSRVLLVVDGPPGGTCKNARYPAVPIVLEEFPSVDLHVLLDDASRPDEKTTITMWLHDMERRNFEPNVNRIKLEKGGCLIKASKKQASDRNET